MKKLIYLILCVSLVSCGNTKTKKSKSIIAEKFQKYNEIEQLLAYTKVSDTIIEEGKLDEEYGILHLKNKTDHLVIFKGITLDIYNNRTYEILDTLAISNLGASEFISIGYCNTAQNESGNLIVIVEQTDSLYIQQLKNGWKANTSSEKIEQLDTLNEITCFNENFED